MASTARVLHHQEEELTKTKVPCINQPLGCWQEATKAGMCAACYRSFRRLRDLEAAEFTQYRRKIRRIAGRADAFAGAAEIRLPERRPAAQHHAHRRKLNRHRGHIRQVR